MRHVTPFFLLIIILGSNYSCNKKTIETNSKNWYKGNLHTHTYWSDGDEFPEVVLDWYKTKGYNFVALSDHNIIAEGKKWKTISSDSIYQIAFQNYLKRYGEDWVIYKIDSGRTQVKLKTYEEYRNRTQTKDTFLVIKSEEITDRYENKHVHMNATNIQERIDPQGGNSIVEVMQNNIDKVIEQRKETGKPIMQHLNHPNFHYSITMDDIIALNGERFFEVYNGHPSVHNMGDSTHISTEEMWDLINIAYIKGNKPLLYGLATDDSHHYHKKGKSFSNAGRGWVMVQSDSLSETSLIHAMEAGDFYASTGVTLKKLEANKEEIAIAVKAEAGITYKMEFIGCKKGSSKTEILKEVEGTETKFTIDDDISFVRCKITSSKLQDNPIENILYETAWTQPILME